jgi:cytochrome P450
MGTGMLVQAVVDEATDAERRARFPRGARVAFGDLEAAGREHVLDDLREHEPVSWLPALGGWLVTSRDGARTVLGREAGMTVEAQENLVRASLGRMMLTVDGDTHARYRRPFEAPFRRSTAHELFAAVIADEATALLDALVGSGEAEFGQAFAAPFAVRMAGRICGLSFADIAQIDRLYAAFAGAMVYDGDPEPQRLADGARAELDEILLAQVARTRREGGSSITAEVARDPEGLTDDEIVANLRVILFGAVETIQASTMNTLLLLLHHPEQLAACRADPALLGGAAEEARRLIPPVAFAERWTTRETDVIGVRIPEREFVGVSILAANRDSATFGDPTGFDIHRENTVRSLSFSFGEHACLGMHLARLETVVALEQILARVQDLELVSADPPSGFAFRRPRRMTLRWRAAATGPA